MDDKIHNGNNSKLGNNGGSWELVKLSMIANTFLVFLVVSLTTVLAFSRVIASEVVVAIYSAALGFAGAGVTNPARRRSTDEPHALENRRQNGGT